MQRINALEKECASLADRLIQGQVTRAQEAEEMFIVKKELSRLKRKVSAIEEEQTKLESEKSEVQINGTIVEEEQNEEGAQGEGEGPVTDRQEDDEKIERQQLIVMAPIHVCREEAEQVLRELGVRTPGTSPRISTAEGPQSSFPEAPKQAKKNLHSRQPRILPSSFTETDTETGEERASQAQEVQRLHQWQL